GTLSHSRKRKIDQDEKRKAAAAAPQIRDMGTVVWFDLSFIPQEHLIKPNRSSSSTQHGSATTNSSKSERGEENDLVASLLAEKELQEVREAAEHAIEESLASEVRSFFECIPRDYRDEIGFTDVLVDVITARPLKPQGLAADTSGNRAGPGRQGLGLAKGGAGDGDTAGGNPRGSGAARRVLRVAFFREGNPLEDLESRLMSQGSEVDLNSMGPRLPLEDVIRKLSIHVDFNLGLIDLLEAMQPWESFRRRLYGPQEDELPNDMLSPRMFARNIITEIQRLSALSEEVPRMGFDCLKTLLKEQGLSDVGTLGELSARAKGALDSLIQRVGYGTMSRFGERAARQLFCSADKDQDGGLSFSEMMGLFRRLGMRAPPRAIATELDYLRALKSMGVRTDKNGYLAEEGLRWLLPPSCDVNKTTRMFFLHKHATSLDSLLDMKLSVISEVDSRAVSHLDALLEPHPLLESRGKLLAFLGRFAVDSHLEYVGESLGEWLALEEGSWARDWLFQPGWVAVAIGRCQQWLADGAQGVIPQFRQAVSKALGPWWAYPPPGSDWSAENVCDRFQEDPADATASMGRREIEASSKSREDQTPQPPNGRTAPLANRREGGHGTSTPPLSRDPASNNASEAVRSAGALQTAMMPESTEKNDPLEGVSQASQTAPSA
ncbi:unnamed protein product, partial [Discosporangium mesarthrocarpum]